MNKTINSLDKKYAAYFKSKTWAISEAGLDCIVENFSFLNLQENIDNNLNPNVVSIESGNLDDIDLEINNGVAIIPVKGGLAKDHGFVGYWSGVNSGYLGIRALVEKALVDFRVKAVLLDIDSPGGTVDGCKELTDFLFNAAKEKPFYTYVNGDMCSAAYWIGSISKVIGAPATAEVGSIGVRTLHADWSAYDENLGINYTHLVAGKFKAAGNPDEPLSKIDREYIQGKLDSLYNIFVSDAARNRNLDSDIISGTEAKVFLAGEAIEIGLIDRIEENIDTFLNTIINREEMNMDKKKLMADFPDLYNQIKAEGVEEEQAKIAEVVKVAEAAVKDNCNAIVNLIVGAEAGEKIKSIIAADLTADQAVLLAKTFSFDGAVQTVVDPVNVDNNINKEILENIKKATPDPVKGDADITNTKTVDVNFDQLVEKQMKETGCKKSKALKDVAAKFPEAHDTWLKNQQK